MENEKKAKKFGGWKITGIIVASGIIVGGVGYAAWRLCKGDTSGAAEAASDAADAAEEFMNR